jgi:hypothetical protein
MKSIYAYLKVFELLDEYWENTRNPDLGSVLSGMNPDPLYETPYLSADPGAYADWSAAWSRIIGVGENGTNRQVFDVAMTILRYYTNEVGYQLGDAEKHLGAGLGLTDSELAIAG